MPEGDTVLRAARRLDAALAGRVLTEFELRVPGFATADLRGEMVEGVVARGKHLLHLIGDWALHSHLRMEGVWDVYPRGERWRRPAFRARAVLGTEEWQAVGFDLAEVRLVPRTALAELLGHLGPDLLGADWDPEEAARRVSADPRPVHVALLDQRNVAGLGNEYANEILFLAGVDPHRPAPEVDVAKVLDIGFRTMHANLDRNRRTFTGDSRPGRATWVYGRDRQSCRRCGTRIRRDDLGADPTRERVVFWCPGCQR